MADTYPMGRTPAGQTSPVRRTTRKSNGSDEIKRSLAVLLVSFQFFLNNS